MDYAEQAALKAKDVAVSTGETAREAATKTKDATASAGDTEGRGGNRSSQESPAGTESKRGERLVSKTEETKEAMEELNQQAGQAKDTAMQTGERAKDYAGGTAAEFKVMKATVIT
ncbi:unnamed protein product [Musa acuminata subsp. malaccensis]|uniref:(wild Malaysian banana) hypothetical protein n=1 Tax=Musa acuminata subsp. malaccensis TaxID=214687 RepID=A0A8D7FFW6_MUSAM|nr:unnamed protein product [Musa acuminata subsp. malaccensis]